MFKDILPGIEPFLSTILSDLDDLGLDVSNYYLDHVCFRTTSLEEYDQLKDSISAIAQLLSEAMIAGRPIASYQLNEAIHFANRKIEVIEIPSPKVGKVVNSGFEHAEFVIDVSFEDFIDRYPNITFDTSSITKRHNPELKVSLGAYTVKFHHKALKEVIAIERAQQQ